MSTAPSTREMLARLVAFPTVSRDGNLDLIAFARDHLEAHGAVTRTVPNAEGTKANLYAQIGPDAAGGIVLSGHTDVVPVDGQAWSTDPFTLVERDGRLYGRGAADMKGFVANVLAAAPAMAAAGLKRPIQIALSYDEEVGCLGAPSMIAQMRETLPPASAVIVGEPTSMKVVTGHKASTSVETHVRGHEVHSSLVHLGVPAVMVAARLIQWHSDRMAENRAAAAAGGLYTPNYTTLHCGMIQGGTARNITAKDCRFTTDFRVLPTESPQDWLDRYAAFAAEVTAEIAAVHPDARVTLSRPHVVPGLRPESAAEGGGAAEALARRLTGDNADAAVSFGTEAGQFQEVGYSAAIVGPGSIDQAHQPDEFIETAQLAAGDRFVADLIADLAA